MSLKGSTTTTTYLEWNDFISYDPRMPERSQLFVKRVFRDDKFIGIMEDEVKKFLEEVEIETQLMLGKENHGISQ